MKTILLELENTCVEDDGRRTRIDEKNYIGGSVVGGGASVESLQNDSSRRRVLL
jgi:hypothetical protein